MLTSNGLLIHKRELFNSIMLQFQVCNSTCIPFFWVYFSLFYNSKNIILHLHSSINYNHSSLLLLIICFLLFNLLKIVITCFRGEVKTRRISRTILLIPAMMKKLKQMVEGLLTLPEQQRPSFLPQFHFFLYSLS